MTENRLDAKAIFNMAWSIESPEARNDYLNQVCRDKPELRDRVARLLQMEAEEPWFLESPAAPIARALLTEAPPESPGTTIGPYKLREQIGEGGMGIVYVAEQEQPIRRKVALKVVKPGMDTREVIARFEAERQALALMDHPHIAKVIDAGTTDSGRPYFVMELVRGLPLTDYCDQAKVPVRERLQLFLKVCQAVQHAHQRGIIHRDLKPSNVMITLHDGTPVPRVIDFGVAKALSQKLTEQTLYTRHAQMVGTPLYMSPEQAELGGADVDTRSDVYSLGVLLYELLTGQTPFDKETFSKLGFDEMRRIIRQEDALRPSHRVSTLGAEARSTISGQRRLDDRQLARTLKGELDWIVMKALEKDRTRRYGSADALAADIARYLNDQPVEACPPSVAYRVRKFVLRKRTTLLPVAIVAPVTLLIGLLLALTVRPTLESPTGPTPATSTPRRNAWGNGRERTPAVAAASPARPALSGLVPQPAEYRGLGRWQVITMLPRSFVADQWVIAWSPDSRFIAFGDGSDVRVYSIPDFRLVRLLAGHSNSVVGIDWSPDGTRLASTSLDHTVRIWNAETGIPGPVLTGHRARVDAVDWHPDGRWLATGSHDNRVRIWTSEGAPGPVLKGHSDAVLSVSWNPDGTLLASTGQDGSIRIWNAHGQLERVIDSNGEGLSKSNRYVKTIAWSRDGQKLLAAQFSLKFARIWNLDGTRGPEFRGHTDACDTADWNPDGTQIVSGSRDNTVRLWKVDGTPGPVLTGHDGNVYCVKWSPSGEWIASGGSDHAIRLWRPDDQRGLVLSGQPSVHSVCWTPDGTTFAAAVGDHTIRLGRADGTQSSVLEGLSRPVAHVAWSPEGRHLASTGVDGRLRIWDVERHAVSNIITASEAAPYERDARGLAWSPRGDWIASTFHRGRHEICLWRPDGTPGPVLLGHQSSLYEVAWSPHGDRLASVSQDGTVRLWKENETAASVFNAGVLLASVAWKPDGTQIASGSDDGTIQLWRPDGTPAELIQGHGNRVTCVEWSRDGCWIASGSRDSTLRLWSAGGEALGVLTGHTNSVMDLSWRPNSRELLSAGEDGTIRLWDVESRQLRWVLVVLRDHDTVAFSAEGQPLAGDPRVFDRDFLYVIERPDGATDLVTPSEFRERIASLQH